MHRIRIKIEGLTDPATAVTIAQMGADAIGLVFAESPRRVDVDTAGRIVRALPPWVSTVGVFVNATAGAINEVVRRTRIGYVQLHGDEGPEMAGQLDARCIKAFRVRDGGWLGEVKGWLAGLDAPGRDNFAAVLLDAYDNSARGGTGKQFNWQWIADARASGSIEGLGPIILAGGLNPECVAQAVGVVQPWAVDVASGVESSPAVKDLAKVAAFIQQVNGGRP